MDNNCPPEKHLEEPEECAWQRYDYSCCVGDALTKGRQDGLGSENMLSLKHSGQNLSPVKGNITTGHSGVQVSSNMLWTCSWPPIIASK